MSSEIAAVREAVFADVEAERHTKGEPILEADLSINDWADRVKGCVVTAHGQARAGDDIGQYQTWIELAAIAVARAELLRAITQ